jgi:hypothetical protein
MGRGDSSPPDAGGGGDEDPDAGADLSTYPDWWRSTIEEFRRYGLPAYRPPRFADDELTPVVVESLEETLSVTIRLRAIDPQDGEPWRAYVDGDPVTELPRHRDADGYTRYELTSTEFEDRIRAAVLDE